MISHRKVTTSCVDTSPGLKLNLDIGIQPLLQWPTTPSCAAVVPRARTRTVPGSTQPSRVGTKVHGKSHRSARKANRDSWNQKGAPTWAEQRKLWTFWFSTSFWVGVFFLDLTLAGALTNHSFDGYYHGFSIDFQPSINLMKKWPLEYGDCGAKGVGSPFHASAPGKFER